DFAGLGYHSPNLELAHARHLQRGATAFDQEAIATLILSGRFVGFLPDHYADAFVQRGQLRAVAPASLHYACDFVSVLRRSPQPPRAALAFHQALRAAHGA
ncbi:MAG TPA: LysR substrate-binding domain-containing protein, partial [Ottowia sp.]|nr:LysR substrate-binding domain-containing protein [Ottowia sp.]